MGYYDVGMVCLNGHAITDNAATRPQLQEKHCSTCGAETITSCPHCNTAIRGEYASNVVVIGFAWTPPANCHECGKSYIWTEKKSQALAEMLEELDGLDETEKAKLKLSIADIIADTPNSGTAILRFKKAAKQAGQVGGKLLMDVLAKVAAEAVKKSMGL